MLFSLWWFVVCVVFIGGFACLLVELNGDVEDNPDLVNEDAYQDGWCMIVRPHEWDEDMYLDQSEYIEYLNEI